MCVCVCVWVRVCVSACACVCWKKIWCRALKAWHKCVLNNRRDAAKRLQGNEDKSVCVCLKNACGCACVCEREIVKVARWLKCCSFHFFVAFFAKQLQLVLLLSNQGKIKELQIVQKVNNSE